MRAVKRDTAPWARRHDLGRRLAEEIGDEIRGEFLGTDATLVPMPGHAPMKAKLAHWASRELCEVFLDAGLGSQWLPLLQRTEAVPKSSTSANEGRPSAQRHFESLKARPDLGAAMVLTVVDDVITRGATMLAAVARLEETFPSAEVRGFALIRTISDRPIAAVKEPARGTVRVVPWGTRREP